MMSEAPNASWHPALMPNSRADIPHDIPAHLSSSLSDHLVPARSGAEVRFAPSDHGDDTHHQSLGPDEWFPDYSTSNNWIHEANDAPPAAEPPSQHPDVPGVIPDDESDASSTTSNQANRNSFARTVSHEVNWNDDDDPEWNLPRTATIEPFKSMPPSDRTNSFPPVPPLEHQEESEPEPEHQLAQPLPPNHAEEVVHEVESEELLDTPGFFGHDPESLGNGYDTHALEDDSTPNRYAGGDLQTAQDASEARFTEGVPLISPAVDGAPGEDISEGGKDLFGDGDATEEDDFFAKVRDSEGTQPDEHTPPALERKSTTQVLESLDMGSSRAGFTPLEETPEGEETNNAVEATTHDHASGVGAEPSITGTNDEHKTEPAVDLDAKWKEVFEDDDDDEDFLPDDSAEEKQDPAAFLMSDDDGLLEDDDGFLDDSEDAGPAPGSYFPQNEAPKTNGQYAPPSQTSTAPSGNPYIPAAPAQAPSNPYLPATSNSFVQPPTVTPFAVPSSAPPVSPAYGYGAQPPRPEQNKAQSFADKAKGGYTSPYDLPMEVVKPKKRVSMQNLQRSSTAPHPPLPGPPQPRSISLNSHLPSPPQSAGHGGPQAAVTPAGQAQPNAQRPPQEIKGKGSFFEELPILAKTRPVSRQSLPSPSQASPYGQSFHSAPPPPPSAHAAPPAPPSQSQPPADIPQLVAPARLNPYASLPSSAGLSPTIPAVTSNRYSPAPPSAPHINGSAPPSRYSPAPPASRQPSGGYAASSVTSAPPILPHQPRTSSPLAHFELSHEKSRGHAPSHIDVGLAERRSSSSMYDPRLQRVSSLPTTKEVEEEEGASQFQPSAGQFQPQPASPPDTRYGRQRQTPPPSSLLGHSTSSPPKRSTSTHNIMGTSQDFVPPPRSQTQSPGALYGNRNGKSSDIIPRPSSVHAPVPPQTAMYSAAVNQHSYSAPHQPATFTRPRGFSQNLNLVAPTDGRENDVLQRWRGAPLISWGVGGAMVTMFPKDVPRYGMNPSAPMVVRSPGDVKIKNVKDIQPLEDRIAKFPGPLKGKSKKKETITWLTTGIESLERGTTNNLFRQQHTSHDEKRTMERLLLWKILRLFIEYDGALEGNPAVEKAVREILTPELGKPNDSPTYITAADLPGMQASSTTTMHSDTVDSTTVEQIRRHLMNGDREKAVWTAVDKRMWGHALLLANALAPALYTQVAQEFVKKEVNLPGQNNESLAALYEVLSGSHEESVDELVPVHARAGLQLMAKDPASGPSKDAMEGLDKWRETLGLILSNRSTDDARAINSLGNMLSGYGRAEAAHICFLFARSHSVFGGLDDPASKFVLVGSDHRRQPEQFAKEIEPLLLSEVYEYGQSLAAGNAAVPVTNPHLAAYKLQHAYALAEYGLRDKAMQYCEAIASAITAQTRRSPYHHPILEAAVEDLMKRLKQAPKEESNSWIPKPSMNKVSDTVWNRFNKFVAGEENDSSGPGSPNETGESGPFARIAGGTPTISRPPSTNNLETFGASVPNYGMPAPAPPANGPVVSSAPPTRAASRYAPGAAQTASAGSNHYEPSSTYAPRSSMERTSSELNRSSIDLPRRSSEFQAGYSGPFSPNGTTSSGYTPYHGTGLGLSQESPYSPASQPNKPQQSSQASARAPAPASALSYGPPGYSSAPTNGVNYASSPSLDSKKDMSPQATSQPAPYGYEPPSFTPYEPAAAEEKNTSNDAADGGSYEAPSYQPYGYEPPSYDPQSQPAEDDDESSDDSKPRPKKKGIMYGDDEDDFPVPKPAEKTKEDRDRENAEMFRKAAEEDAKRAAEAKQAKKGWGFGGWFGGGGAKKEAAQETSAPNKPIRAKLGEANSFYYDPEQKRWVNKNAGAEDSTAKKTSAPPPRGAGPPRSASSSPAPPPMAIPGGRAVSADVGGRASAPPGGLARSSMTPPASSLGPPGFDTHSQLAGSPSGSASALPPMMRSVSNMSNASAASAPGASTGPPTRPPMTLSASSSIDDLIGAAGPRKAGPKKPRKSARYVDVMTDGKPN
ncbi:Sec23-binding domain of Sec16-domain-containing protein [Cercophora scortea]|uniref:Protein transport protein sec16 n=1 Tax=Cercophora scortea TaxID=314031 RepID=A0AAE0IP23_9PEZI|nr:Sec23-binding domain of Sec16-domain-containing protein [Cercophora scortea]